MSIHALYKFSLHILCLLHRCFQSRLLQICCMLERIKDYCLVGFNPFPHTTILQQTTLNIFCQKTENIYNWMDNLWLKVENIVTKGEIALLCNFLFCYYVFKKPSAAEASESVYMRERVKKSHNSPKKKSPTIQ